MDKTGDEAANGNSDSEESDSEYDIFLEAQGDNENTAAEQTSTSFDITVAATGDFTLLRHHSTIVTCTNETCQDTDKTERNEKTDADDKFCCIYEFINSPAFKPFCKSFGAFDSAYVLLILAHFVALFSPFALQRLNSIQPL